MVSSGLAHAEEYCNPTGKENRRMKSPYSFRNFWLPFIIMNIVIILVVTLTQTMDTGLGILYLSIFYFYNRGRKNAQEQYRRD